MSGTIVKGVESQDTLYPQPAGHHIVPAALGTSALACSCQEAPWASKTVPNSYHVAFNSGSKVAASVPTITSILRQWEAKIQEAL